jgi:hypothetical protein
MKNMKKKNENYSVKTNVTVSIEEIENLLCSACEGGSNYWYRVENKKLPLDKNRCVDYAKIARGKCTLLVSEYPQTESTKISGRISKKSIARALQLMADKYPRHFGDIMQDNSDSETADVFFQLAVLGDLIYG